MRPYLGDQSPDFLRSLSMGIGFENRQSLAGAFGESHSLGYSGAENRKTVAGESFGNISADCCIYDFTINRKSGFQRWFHDYRFVYEIDDLLGAPYIVGRRLYRDNDQVRCQDCRTGHIIYPRRSVYKTPAIGNSEPRKVTMYSALGKADHVKKWLDLPRRTPVQPTALGICIDIQDGFASQRKTSS